ncbi:hypothetical protein NP493_244g03029 [Ridgeia piscesae]|uniref:Semaphorin-2A n=1 Tax=Ridgeia piscesae TaxID=27915 RepID=A0AAD9NZ83_RIDPI|nr:hypothetical protein NP493_244g03029 [Ridgeia piscesae]
MAVDEANNQLIVGARDYLLRLDLEKLNTMEVVEWKPKNMTATICEAKGKNAENCHNYVRVLLLHKNYVFTCGTNAFYPQCTWREVTNLKTIKEEIKGVGMCPYDPAFNNSALITSNGNFYSATVTDFNARDAAIYRIMGPSKKLRTLQFNSKWLNEPNFVSTYEIGDFIYFFFRETAVEYINCGKTIYSRVARICKSDTGGNVLLEENWTSFMKARLNCSIPGSFPFYFSELQSTYYNKEQGLIYASFTTSPTSIYGTAVCVYDMAAIQAAFEGPFKYQENPEMAWGRKPNKSPHMQCSSSNSKRSLPLNETPVQRLLVDAQKFQMMDLAVQPVEKEPFVIAELERYTHIVVDTVKTREFDSLDVIFVADLEGVIKKLVRVPGTNKTCVVEEIHISEEDQRLPIRSMKLVKEQDALYIGTEYKLMRIPLHRCSRFKSKILCMNSQDPYCAWNERRGACARLPSSMHSHWLQNITSCPMMKYPVVGGWSLWSSWEPCQNTGEPRTGDKCICRRRSCDTPVPRFGGERCQGVSVEVTNCTNNGGWTTWSEWSTCSQSCGIAVRSRHRSCGNPEPQFGGRTCVGSNIDTQYCLDNPLCIEPTKLPVVSEWSAWGQWAPCTAKCGGGVKIRHRQCNNPTPSEDRIGCVGNNQEWKMCNHHKCPEMRRASSWTPWVRVNSSADGYIEQRYRFICKSTVSAPSMLRVSHMKADARFCSKTGADCDNAGPHSVANVDGQWSSWSAWTECNAPCGGGEQRRERGCNSPLPSGSGKDCLGYAQEIRHCNEHSCKGKWSCWTDFSVCSATCGQGYKIRTRHCEAEIAGSSYTIPCYGSNQEQLPCKLKDCQLESDKGGWTEWTVWSVCGENSVQERKRDCQTTFAIEGQCDGAQLERRMCSYNKIDVVVAESREARSRSCRRERFQVYHLIITAFAGFIFGGVVCIGIFLYCQRQRRDDINKFSTMQHQEAIPNPYMCPSDLELHHVYTPLAGLNNKYYSTGSLKKKDSNKLTVREATLKRSSLMSTNTNSLMRTNLDWRDNDY